MKFKKNRLAGFIHFILSLLCAAGLNACGNDIDKNKIIATDSLQSAILEKNDLTDSIKYLLNISASKDTFEYKAFYNDNRPYQLLYVKTGNLFNDKIKHALALHTINDTTIVCELWYLIDGKWVACEEGINLYVSEFSPAYFSVLFDDYNFDGRRDLMINVFHSMGAGYSYGYILTFDKQHHLLLLHPETVGIPNIEIDKKCKKIYSTEYFNHNTGVDEYKIVSYFGWSNDSLKFISNEKMKLTIMRVKL